MGASYNTIGFVFCVIQEYEYESCSFQTCHGGCDHFYDLGFEFNASTLMFLFAQYWGVGYASQEEAVTVRSCPRTPRMDSERV